HGNRSWQGALPPREKAVKVWVPTLYLGGLTLVLALAAARFPSGGPRRVWMPAVGVLSPLVALGGVSCPLLYARHFPSVSLPRGRGRARRARPRPAGVRPPRRHPPRRRRRRLLVPGHGAAGVPPVSLPEQAADVHHGGPGRPGGPGLGRPGARRPAHAPEG